MGVIYTVDSQSFNVVEAMAVRNGKIIAIGHNDDILHEYQATEMEWVEWPGSLPGFIDAHCHFLAMPAIL